MKMLIGLLALTTLAFGQTVNSQRFSATDIHYTRAGAVAELRGNVVVKTRSAIIHAESADLEISHYAIAVHGDSRWDFLPARSKPDFNEDYLTNPRPANDPGRLRAEEVLKRGEVTHLHGNVVIRMPGITIYAEDADFNPSNATAVIHGDSRLVFMKALVEPDDNLGPLWVFP